MSTTNRSKPVARLTRAPTFGPQVLFGIAVFAAFAVLAGAVTVLPNALVAPVASTLLLVMAVAAALIGWLREGGADVARVTYWDVAGALTFIGICVASTVEPNEMVALIEAADRRP